MVSRSNTSKTIRRRTGGTGTKPTLTARQAMSGEIGSHKRTSLDKINKERGDWEMVPGTGTSPYNPPEWRKKKITKASKAKTAAARKKYLEDPQSGAAALGDTPLYSKGGKVKKRKGGTVKKRKGGTPKRKYSKGGSVSRRGGGKIMIGYKAGGKV